MLGCMSHIDGTTLPTDLVRPPRLRSLDAFRGLTIAAMLIVNNPGTWENVYPALRHASWHGCTPTDLIFPFFLFIVGVSIAFSHRLNPRRAALLNIGQRSATLILIGLAMNLLSVLLRGDTTLSAWRLPGVLQRIGVCYAFVAIVQVLGPPNQRRLGRLPLGVVIEAIGVLITLIAYAWMLRQWTAPESGADSLSMNGTIVAYMDRLILGSGHMYRSGLHDPEGLLSTLPAICTTFIGLWFGKWIRSGPTSARSVMIGGLFGTALAACGWAWSVVPVLGVPLNKELWTSSYVLFTAGWAIVGLSICIALWDIWGRSAGWKHPRAFLCPAMTMAEIMGRNAMVAFVGSGVLARLLGAIRTESGLNGKPATAGRWVYEHCFAYPERPELGSLLYALAMLGIWCCVLLVLEKKRWYWKV